MTDLALLVYAAAQLADIVTTVRGIRRGAAERMPAVRALMAALGHGWIAVKWAASLAAAFALVALDQVGWIWALSAVVAAVAVNNLRVTR